MTTATTATNAPTGIVADPFKDGVTRDALAVMIEVLGSEQGRIAGQRVATAFTTLARLNPKIRECTPASVVQCVATCAITELMPGGALPKAWIIPRERRFQRPDGEWDGVQELNFQVAARGLIELARRAGMQIGAYASYVGAPVNLDANGRLIIPTERRTVNRSMDALIGVIVTGHDMATGTLYGPFFVEWDVIESARARSDAWRAGQEETHTKGRKKGQKKTPYELERDRSSPWYTDFEAMCLKAAIAWVIRRGFIPTDDVSAHVLKVDADADDRRIIDGTATVVERVSAKERIDRALGLDPDPTDYAEAAKSADRERVAVKPDEAADARAAVVPPAFAAFSAELGRFGLDAGAVADWWKEETSADIRAWPEADLIGLYKRLTVDGSPELARFHKSPFSGGK